MSIQLRDSDTHAASFRLLELFAYGRLSDYHGGSRSTACDPELDHILIRQLRILQSK